MPKKGQIIFLYCKIFKRILDLFLVLISGQMIPLKELKLAEADDPGVDLGEEPRIIGTTEKVSHRSSLFVTCYDRLSAFRRQGQAIDIVIKTGPLRIGAHKIVLAASIPFFQGLFLSPVAPTGNEIDLDIPAVDPNIIISIVEWAY